MTIEETHTGRERREDRDGARVARVLGEKRERGRLLGADGGLEHRRRQPVDQREYQLLLAYLARERRPAYFFGARVRSRAPMTGSAAASRYPTTGMSARAPITTAPSAIQSAVASCVPPRAQRALHELRGSAHPEDASDRAADRLAPLPQAEADQNPAPRRDDDREQRPERLDASAPAHRTPRAAPSPTASPIQYQLTHYRLSLGDTGLEAVDHLEAELRGARPVHHTVVEGDRDVADLAHRDLAVTHDRRARRSVRC